MTDAERQAALEVIAAEVRACTRCRLHQARSNAVPGEGSPDTEVMFVGEGPGFNEDRQGRPFVGRAGEKLTEWIESIGWRRRDVFITNIVKCRPPDNRDPMPDEIAACTPFLRRQLAALDPAVVVTLGRFSMGWFTPGTRISQVHGTARLADPATGAPEATVYAMYHPAAALRSPEVERQAADDMFGVPLALLSARERRTRVDVGVATPSSGAVDLGLDLDPALVTPDAGAGFATTADSSVAKTDPLTLPDSSPEVTVSETTAMDVRPEPSVPAPAIVPGSSTDAAAVTQPHSPPAVQPIDIGTADLAPVEILVEPPVAFADDISAEPPVALPAGIPAEPPVALPAGILAEASLPSIRPPSEPIARPIDGDDRATEHQLTLF